MLSPARRHRPALDVPEPDSSRVVALEPGVTLAREVLHRVLDLVLGPVRSLSRLRVLVEVDRRDLLPVQLHADLASLARDHLVVPFARGLHRLLARRYQVVDCTA